MRRKPVGPVRKLQLEAYVKCLRRAERRIVFAHHIVSGARFDPDYPMRKWRNHVHQVASMRRSGFTCYAEALVRLRLTRSQFQAELDGLTW
jgi:hypothetical protein